MLVKGDCLRRVKAEGKIARRGELIMARGREIL